MKIWKGIFQNFRKNGGFFLLLYVLNYLKGDFWRFFDGAGGRNPLFMRLSNFNSN